MGADQIRVCSLLQSLRVSLLGSWGSRGGQELAPREGLELVDPGRVGLEGGSTVPCAGVEDLDLSAEVSHDEVALSRQADPARLEGELDPLTLRVDPGLDAQVPEDCVGAPVVGG